MENLITVAEYAKRTGTSTTAVYKKLSTSLKPFLTIVESKKYIDIAALENSQQNTNKAASNHKVSNDNDEIDNGLKRQLEQLQAENERLKAELAAAKENADKFFRLADQAQQLHRADQQRLIDAQEQIKLLSAASEKVADTETHPIIEGAQSAAKSAEAATKKKSWWSWLWE